MSGYQNYPAEEKDYLVGREGELGYMVVRGFSAKDAVQRWAGKNDLDGTARVFAILAEDEESLGLYEVSGPEKEGEWVGWYKARLIEERK